MHNNQKQNETIQLNELAKIKVCLETLDEIEASILESGIKLEVFESSEEIFGFRERAWTKLNKVLDHAHEHCSQESFDINRRVKDRNLKNLPGGSNNLFQFVDVGFKRGDITDLEVEIELLKESDSRSIVAGLSQLVGKEADPEKKQELASLLESGYTTIERCHSTTQKMIQSIESRQIGEIESRAL